MLKTINLPISPSEIKTWCQKHEISLLILFGSRSKGVQHETSDWDIAIRFNDLQNDIDKLALIRDLEQLIIGTVDMLIKDMTAFSREIETWLTQTEFDS